MRKTNENGFTFIKLLGIIIILGIIGTIATIFVMGIIERTKTNEFKKNVENIIESALLKKDSDDNSKESNEIYDVRDDLTYEGDKLFDGFAYVLKSGDIQVNVWDENNKWCGYKGYGDTEVFLEQTLSSLEECLYQNGKNNVTYDVTNNASTSITGTFIQPWLFKSWTDEMWEEEIGYWKEIGIEYLVMGDVAERQEDGSWITYYDSSLPFASEKFYSILDQMFRNLKGTGIKLFLGTGMDTQWWNLNLVNEADQQHFYEYCEDAALITEELYNMYYPNYSDVFSGFYFVPEISNSSSFANELARTNFVTGLSNGLNVVIDKINKLNSTLPLTFSPYINYFGGDWVTKEPEAIEKFYTQLLDTANFRDGDILIPQDGLGANGMDLQNLPRFTKAYKNATMNSTKDIKFWYNLEVYSQPKSELLYTTDGANYWATATINRVIAQMNIARFYTDNIFVFAYSHYISPQNAISGFRETLNEYFIRGSLDNIKPKAPTSVRTKIEKVNDKDVLSVTWEGASDNYGIARVNIYKNDELFTFRVPNRDDSTYKKPAYPTNFYDADFDLKDEKAKYEIEVIDCAGNKSERVSFTVKKGQTSNIIKVK